MGITKTTLWIQTNLLQCFYNVEITFLSGFPNPMNFKAFCNNLRNTHARTPRAVRILEDDLHFASQGAQFLPPIVLNFIPMEPNPSLAFFKAKHGHRKSCFS